MSLHYLDPEREPRECQHCYKGIRRIYETYTAADGNLRTRYSHNVKCDVCGGSARLGVEGAEPDVEVIALHSEQAGWRGSEPRRAYVWRRLSDHCGDGERYPTESAALEAARKAHREAK